MDAQHVLISTSCNNKDHYKDLCNFCSRNLLCVNCSTKCSMCGDTMCYFCQEYPDSTRVYCKHCYYWEQLVPTDSLWRV